MLDKLLNKFIYYSAGCARAFPCILLVGSLIFSVIFQHQTALIFGIYFIIIDLLCGGLKKTGEMLYSWLDTDYIPFLGQGSRPKGAKYCACFITEDNLEGTTSSFGMPSGHSMLAIFTAVFWSLYIMDNYPDNKNRIISLLALNGMCLSICVSRLILNCHTLGQVIIGGIVGGVIGYYVYKYPLIKINLF